jgi:hypothetical protein
MVTEKDPVGTDVSRATSRVRLLPVSSTLAGVECWVMFGARAPHRIASIVYAWLTTLKATGIGGHDVRVHNQDVLGCIVNLPPTAKPPVTVPDSVAFCSTRVPQWGADPTPMLGIEKAVSCDDAVV